MLARRARRGGVVGGTGKAHATKLTIWVGWSAAGAERVQEGRGRVRRQERGRIGQGGRLDQRRQDHRRAPLGERAGRRQLVHVVRTSGLLPVGRLDRPRPVPQARQDRASIFPAATMYYTQYKGTRCALPLLADVYGFYYNKALFKKAGLTAPPKTFAELTAYAKKLTTRKARRLPRRRRLRPGLRLLPELDRRVPAARRREVLRPAASPPSRRDPGWATLLNWQKSLIDYYGHDKLVKWQTGAGDEFSASHAFERGKLAMMIDGEWRVAFLAADHKGLKYGTAPMPAPRAAEPLRLRLHQRHDHRDPEGGKNRDEAWKLVKYLTTNNHALATFSNGIRNVPSTASSTKSKELKPDANFATFGKMFVNPKSSTIPDHPDRRRPPPDVPELHRQVAGGEGQRPARRSRGGRQADRREAEAGGRRRDPVP